jgi:hypothetical protein
MPRFGSRSRTGSYVSSWMPHNGPITLTGGSISPTTVGSYTYLIFTSTGTLSIGAGPSLATFQVCAIGGGGGAGFGGGGGGAIEYWNNITVSPLATPTISITIGSGGTATDGGPDGGNGGDTTVGSFVTAKGGGGGGGFNNAGKAGGSGGGGGWGTFTAASANGSNTNVGGTGQTYEGSRGGGATQTGNAGGQGLLLTTIDSNLTSTNFAAFSGMTYVSSGGGYGGYLGYGASYDGGDGGTGAGTNAGGYTVGTNAVSYGSGGAGGDRQVSGEPWASSGTGKSGLVIVRWQ